MSTQESTQQSSAESSNSLCDLRVALARLEEQFKAQVDDLSKQLAISQQLSTVQTQIGYFKITGLVLSVALTIAAFFGFKTFSDVVSGATRGLNTRVQQNSDFAEGATLAQSHDYVDAIPYLERSLERDRYDEAILIPLLNAYDETDRWEASRELIDQLQQDPKRFSQLHNPMTYNNMAAAEIPFGLYEPRYLDQGYQHLVTALKLVDVNDSEAHGFIYYNLWNYWLIKGDLPKAEAYVKLLRSVPTHPKDTWNTARKWRFLRVYLDQYPGRTAVVKNMWEEIRSGPAASST